MRAAIVAAIILSAIAAAAGRAEASGGLDCGAKDKNAAFSLQAGVTRGMGSPIFSLSGSTEIEDKSVAADLRKTKFGKEHVAQYWLDAKDLRLLLYRERSGDKPHGYVELIIRTKAAGDEFSFNGTYELIVYDGRGDDAEPQEAKFTGKVRCSVE